MLRSLKPMPDMNRKLMQLMISSAQHEEAEGCSLADGNLGPGGCQHWGNVTACCYHGATSSSPEPEHRPEDSQPDFLFPATHPRQMSFFSASSMISAATDPLQPPSARAGTDSSGNTRELSPFCGGRCHFHSSRRPKTLTKTYTHKRARTAGGALTFSVHAYPTSPRRVFSARREFSKNKE